MLRAGFGLLSLGEGDCMTLIVSIRHHPLTDHLEMYCENYKDNN